MITKISKKNYQPRLLSVYASLVFMIILSFSAARATESAAIAYETQLAIPWKFVEQTINSESTSPSAPFQFSFSDTSYSVNGVPFVIPQMQLEMLIHLKPVQSSLATTIWETDLLALKFKIDSFKVQKDIEQYIGGVHAIVHLQAECSSFVVAQPQAHVQFSWNWSVINNQIHAELKDLALAWPADSWQVSDIQCNGPVGFADVIQQELREKLAQADSLAPLIRSTIEKTLNTQMNLSLDQWKQPQWLNQSKFFNIQLTETKILNSAGILFKGLMRFSEASVNEKIEPLLIAENLQPQTTPMLIFSNAAMQKLVEKLALNANHNLNLNQISAFKKILKSRFLQFFIWSDLMHFSKQDTFTLFSKLTTVPKLNFGTDLSLNLEAQLSSVIQAPRDSQILNYVQIQTQVKSKLQYSVENGKFSFQFANPDIQIRAQYDPSYKQKYKPWGALPTSLLQKAVQEAQLLRSGSVAIPSFKLNDSVSLQADNLKRLNADTFAIEMKKDDI